MTIAFYANTLSTPLPSFFAEQARYASVIISQAATALRENWRSQDTTMTIETTHARVRVTHPYTIHRHLAHYLLRPLALTIYLAQLLVQRTSCRNRLAAVLFSSSRDRIIANNTYFEPTSFQSTTRCTGRWPL